LPKGLSSGGDRGQRLEVLCLDRETCALVVDRPPCLTTPLGQPLEELLDGEGHGETSGSDADAGPAAVADDGHAGVGHAFHEIVGEVAVAGVDPLASAGSRATHH
jgi:hypothetical protein